MSFWAIAKNLRCITNKTLKILHFSHSFHSGLIQNDRKTLTQFLHFQPSFHESAIWEDTSKKMHSFGIQAINWDIFSFLSIGNSFLNNLFWRNSWLVNCRSFFESDIPYFHEISFHPDWADSCDGDSAFFEFLI